MQADNISFKGGFVQNEVLQKAIKHARKSDIKRFLQLQKNIEGIDDDFIYKLGDITRTLNIDRHANTSMYGREFNIELENICSGWAKNKFRHLKTFLIPPHLIKDNNYINYTGKFYKNLLRKVCSIIEQDYPQFVNEKSSFRRTLDKFSLGTTKNDNTVKYSGLKEFIAVFYPKKYI